MQISSLTDIVEGSLQNTPAISFITQIHTQVSKVNEGDAFFALEPKDIPQAIEKGAFAIIYENRAEILDQEIAWIKVDQLSKSISNVLRYKLINYQNKYIFTNDLFLHLLKIFRSKALHSLVILDKNIEKDFELLNNIDEDKLIFSTDRTFLNNIATDIFVLENKRFHLENLTIHSLFETSFSYKERYFDRVKIPRVYVDYFLQVCELFEYNLDLKKLSSFNLFQPIFINKSNQIVPFGQTNRFILSNSCETIYTQEIQYLQEHYNYAKIIIVDGLTLTDKEILAHIETETFNALYFKNYELEKIIEVLKNNIKENPLI